MSALFAVAGGLPLSPDALEAAVREMSARGADRVEARSTDGAGLAVGRFEWEVTQSAPGPVLHDDGVRIVAADASLYYRGTLVRAIRGAMAERPFDIGGDSASHLILAAYRVWGADCARHLEGDFSFALWDRSTQTMVCARDFIGARSLYFGQSADALVVASHASVVARRTPHAGALDVVAIGETLASLFNVGEATSYLGVRVVPPGHTVTRTRDGTITVAPHWTAPTVDDSGASSFEQGAEELRELLTDAVDERMSAHGTTAIWLSGGWDSSSILACATRALERNEAGRRLTLVSMSYPVGNLGREDEAIQSVADRFGRAVTWCDSSEVRLLPPNAAEHAARRDLPFAHGFESWSRAMVARSTDLGARVVLTGTGGDELFAGTNLYLCDLFRSGHWLSLAAEWYRIRGRTLQGFGTQVVRPAFAARRPDSRLSEGGPLEQGALTWMSADFIRTHRFLERERAGAPYERYRSLNAAEMHWAVTAPLFSRIRSTLSAAQLEAGVTHRSPFFDGRLLRFAMSRPRAERVSARETKRLLRRAMKGLLPDEFLAPRPERTGVTTQYMRDEVQRVARYELSKAFEQPVLAELGIIDRDVLRREWNLFLDTGNTFGLRFFELYQVEMWVRAHIGAGIGEHQSRAAMPAASV